jgi:isoquinoline 1-oxidoreductase beta subunit
VESVALRERLLAAVDGDRGRLFDGWASSRTPPDDPARPARFQTALDASEGDHQAIYECPLLAHATMEPMSCVAQVTADGARLWMGAQTQSRVQEAVAAELGLARERVEVITVLAGGGFGRRSELDVPLQAARIAREVAGRPIKLIWSREEDIQHGYYRPASAVRLHAGLGPDGLPRALSFHSACPSVWKHSVWGAKEAKGQFDFNVFMGRFRSPYALGEVLPTWSEVDLGVRVGTWRSVGESQNLFALESFLDELAERAGIDPAEYRRRLLRGRIRELAVLEAALDRAGWGRKDGRSRGLAMGFANRSVVAQVLELSAAKDEVRLHRVTCVIDCGLAVNPDAVRAQMEGGVVWALSAAAAGEITLEHGAVQQSNFHDYPLAQLAQTPDIDTLVLQTQDQPGGAGEEAVAPFAPALVNALYRATGSRLRSLPLSRHGLRLGPARP